jgi:hypothetical protein
VTSPCSIRQNSRNAAALDVVAHITNVRSTCDDSGEFIVSNATFEVHGQRRNTSGEREVVLPYFATVVQGGTNVVSKRLGRVACASPMGRAREHIGNSPGAGAALGRDPSRDYTPPDHPRAKAGGCRCALDPMADPAVRAAVTRASFEFLVGFQLTQEQLAYNATR